MRSSVFIIVEIHVGVSFAPGGSGMLDKVSFIKPVKPGRGLYHKDMKGDGGKSPCQPVKFEF